MESELLEWFHTIYTGNNGAANNKGHGQILSVYKVSAGQPAIEERIKSSEQ